MSEVMSELVMYVEDLQSQVDELTELCDILDEDLGGEQYGICFRSDDQALCDQIQGAIAELVADGTYKQIAESNKDYADLIPNLIFLQ